MSDTDNYKTMRVPKDAWEKAKAQKEDNDRTWGEQIVRDVDTDSTTSVDTDAIVEQIVTTLEQSDREDFDDWFSPDVAQTIAHHVIAEIEQESVDVDKLIGRIDDLESRLPRKVAEELR